MGKLRNCELRMDLSPAEFLADIEVAVTDRTTDPLWFCPPNVASEVAAKVARIRRTVSSSGGTSPELREAFDDLVSQLGHKRGSHLWLGIFAALDAAETG